MPRRPWGIPAPINEFVDEFWKLVDVKGPDDCWAWNGPWDKHHQLGTYGAGRRICRTRLAHRIAWSLKNDPLPVQSKLEIACGTRNCVNPAHMVLFTNDLEGMQKRFWSLVNKDAPGGCWLWTGGDNGNGYGDFNTFLFGTRLAHRISWMLLRGSIPVGIEVCHNCPTGDNRMCVNPDHAFLGTHADNIRDAWRKGRMSGPNSLIKARGEDHPHSKLTEAVVRSIRADYASGDATVLELSQEFGVSHVTIGRIVNRESWKHVT